MSDLTRFRDHCRAMARGTGDAARVARQVGLLTTANQALWTLLAEEVDAYLVTPAASVDLFGEVGVEPETCPGLPETGSGAPQTGSGGYGDGRGADRGLDQGDA